MTEHCRNLRELRLLADEVRSLFSECIEAFWHVDNDFVGRCSGGELLFAFFELVVANCERSCSSHASVAVDSDGGLSVWRKIFYSSNKSPE